MKIDWGKLVAGAAIVGGVMLVFPFAGKFLVAKAGGIENIGKATPLFQAIGHTGEWMTHGIGRLITAVTGAFVGWKGYKSLTSGDDDPQPNPEASESFAMKEDMRLANARMHTRLAVADPERYAMLTQQQGRG